VTDSLDRVTVAWLRTGGIYEAKAVRLDASGDPGPVRTLSPSGVDVLNPRIAIDPQDRVTVTWEDFHQRVHVMRIGADGAAGPIYPLSAPERLAGHPQVAAAPDGGAMVVWTHPPVVFILPFDEYLDLEFQTDSDVVQAAFIEPRWQPRFRPRSLRLWSAIDGGPGRGRLPGSPHGRLAQLRRHLLPP